MLEQTPQTNIISESDGTRVTFTSLNGLGSRSELEGGAQLGRRYMCAQVVEVKRPDPTNESGFASTSEYWVGILTTLDGREINLGCGTQVLCTKPSPKSAFCCGMPMVLQVPNPLPSSD